MNVAGLNNDQTTEVIAFNKYCIPSHPGKRPAYESECHHKVDAPVTKRLVQFPTVKETEICCSMLNCRKTIH